MHEFNEKYMFSGLPLYGITDQLQYTLHSNPITM